MASTIVASSRRTCGPWALRFLPSTAPVPMSRCKLRQRSSRFQRGHQPRHMTSTTVPAKDSAATTFASAAKSTSVRTTIRRMPSIYAARTPALHGDELAHFLRNGGGNRLWRWNRKRSCRLHLGFSFGSCRGGPVGGLLHFLGNGGGSRLGRWSRRRGCHLRLGFSRISRWSDPLNGLPHLLGNRGGSRLLRWSRTGDCHLRLRFSSGSRRGGALNGLLHLLGNRGWRWLRGPSRGRNCCL